jgi:hypothetical protein
LEFSVIAGSYEDVISVAGWLAEHGAPTSDVHFKLQKRERPAWLGLKRHKGEDQQVPLTLATLLERAS